MALIIKPVATENWAEINVARGAQDFRAGRPKPAEPPEDGSITEPAHARWYGWMTQRGLDMMRDGLVRDWATGERDSPT